MLRDDDAERGARGMVDSSAVRAVVAWVRQRAGESSTWAGMAMIAVALGSDPIAAHGVAQAISLIIGGGLVSLAPGAAPGKTDGDVL